MEGTQNFAIVGRTPSPNGREMTKNTIDNAEQPAQSGIKIYLRNGLYFVLFLMAVQLLTTLTGGD